MEELLPTTVLQVPFPQSPPSKKRVCANSFKTKSVSSLFILATQCHILMFYYSSDEDNERHWFRYILEDGSLFYLEPAFDLPSVDDFGDGASESARKHGDKGDKKDDSRGILRGFGRIKGALKRNTAFGKKEKEGEKNGDAPKDGVRSIHEYYSTNGPSDVSYDEQIVRTTTVVKVNKALPSDLDMKSNLLYDVLGMISGLDLDPVQPLPNGADDTAISRRLDAIAIQGIVPGSPADVNQDINIGR